MKTSVEDRGPEAEGRHSVAPRETHDSPTFQDLSQRYNYLTVSSVPRLLTDLILLEIKRRSRPVRVLDVGSGRGLQRQVEYQWSIRDATDEYWGIEPDESIHPAAGLFEHHQHAMIETASLPAAAFDVVYSSMVMEHVADPDGFMRAVHRCLKPGGSYLFATPNGHSFFAIVSKALHKICLDQRVLRLIKGRGKMEAYHYPVAYHFNTPRVIDACARRIGFCQPDYAFVEGRGGRGYFPKPLRLIYYLIMLKRRTIKNPRCLSTLICRMVKPPTKD